MDDDNGDVSMEQRRREQGQARRALGDGITETTTAIKRLITSAVTIVLRILHLVDGALATFLGFLVALLSFDPVSTWTRLGLADYESDSGSESGDRAESDEASGLHSAHDDQDDEEPQIVMAVNATMTGGGGFLVAHSTGEVICYSLDWSKTLHFYDHELEQAQLVNAFIALKLFAKPIQELCWTGSSCPLLVKVDRTKLGSTTRQKSQEARVDGAGGGTPVDKLWDLLESEMDVLGGELKPVNKWEDDHLLAVNHLLQWPSSWCTDIARLEELYPEYFTMHVDKSARRVLNDWLNCIPEEYHVV